MMNCPPEIAYILLEMLETGLQSIRALGWKGEAGRCAVEADHLHNLPRLLADYDPVRLLYYWDVERLDYTESPIGYSLDMESAWERLEPQVEAIRSLLATT
jgi:hypothetical protein